MLHRRGRRGGRRRGGPRRVRQPKVTRLMNGMSLEIRKENDGRRGPTIPYSEAFNIHVKPKTPYSKCVEPKNNIEHAKKDFSMKTFHICNLYGNARSLAERTHASKAIRTEMKAKYKLKKMLDYDEAKKENDLTKKIIRGRSFAARIHASKNIWAAKKAKYRENNMLNKPTPSSIADKSRPNPYAYRGFYKHTDCIYIESLHPESESKQVLPWAVKGRIMNMGLSQTRNLD